MKYLLIVFGFALFVYLLGAFVTVHFDITKWSEGSRFITAFFFCVFTIFGCLFIKFSEDETN